MDLLIQPAEQCMTASSCGVAAGLLLIGDDVQVWVMRLWGWPRFVERLLLFFLVTCLSWWAPPAKMYTTSLCACRTSVQRTMPQCQIVC